ncbi:MAG: flagellar biosynthetic protein FliO [Desulfobulbaceae bacterium]|nr:flagellar biosynthetic protein FliO [Desulfobulbaceae bacterium]
MRRYFIFTIGFLFFSTSAQAAESLTMGSGLLRMLWALLIVIGVILIIFGLVKKRFGLGRMQQGTIKVLELRHIMPKTTLALVEVRGKVMLLGIGAGQINLLADYPESTSKESDFDALLAEQQ